MEVLAELRYTLVVAHFPDLELGLVKAGSDEIADVGVRVSVLGAYEIGGILELNDGGEAVLATLMRAKLPFDAVLLNAPHFDHAFGSAHQKEVFVDLEEAGRLSYVLVGLLEGAIAGLKFHFADDGQSLSPIRDAHHRARAQLEALPLKLDHGVVRGGLGPANQHGRHRSDRLIFLLLLFFFLLLLVFLIFLTFLVFAFDLVAILVQLLFLRLDLLLFRLRRWWL